MARILVIYESKYGQTEKIAKFIVDKIHQAGHSAEALECHSQEFVGLAKYDGVIVGGAVYAKGYPRAAIKWVKQHAEALNKKPTAFFSVCLGILESDPKVQKEEREVVQGFFDKTGWTPQKWTIFAGGLRYSKYNWFIRRIMRQIAKRQGGDTDVSHDYEYTDWIEVTKFTQDFIGVIPKISPSPIASFDL